MENGNSILKKFNIFQYLLGTKHQTNRIYMISLNLCDNLASNCYPDVHFSYIQLLSCIWLCNPIDYSMPGLPVHHQLPQSTKPMSIESVMPFNHLILYCPLLLLPSILPSFSVFSNESVLCIRWPKYWSFTFSISPSNEHSGLISFRITGLISLQSKGLSRVFSNKTVQKHQFFGR